MVHTLDPTRRLQVTIALYVIGASAIATLTVLVFAAIPVRMNSRPYEAEVANLTGFLGGMTGASLLVAYGMRDYVHRHSRGLMQIGPTMIGIAVGLFAMFLPPLQAIPVPLRALAYYVIFPVAGGLAASHLRVPLITPLVAGFAVPALYLLFALTSRGN